MLIETIDAGDGWTIERHYDEDGSYCDPTDWDGRASFALAHKRYDLRDDLGMNWSLFGGWQEAADAIVESENPVVILPVYMMDHGNVSLSTGAYSCPWDSGQVGFVYATQADLDRWGWTGTEDQLVEDLSRQVRTYGQWLNGEVYGYVVEGPNGESESCWGFVGDDGDTYMMDEARSQVEWLKADLERRKAEGFECGLIDNLKAVGLAS